MLYWTSCEINYASPQVLCMDITFPHGQLAHSFCLACHQGPSHPATLQSVQEFGQPFLTSPGSRPLWERGGIGILPAQSRSGWLPKEMGEGLSMLLPRLSHHQEDPRDVPRMLSGPASCGGGASPHVAPVMPCSWFNMKQNASCLSPHPTLT